MVVKGVPCAAQDTVHCFVGSCARIQEQLLVRLAWIFISSLASALVQLLSVDSLDLARVHVCRSDWLR